MGSGEEDREVQEAHVQGADVVPRGVVAAHLDWDVAEGCSLQVDSPALFRYTVFCLQSAVEDHRDDKSCNKQSRRSFTLEKQMPGQFAGSEVYAKAKENKIADLFRLGQGIQRKDDSTCLVKNRESRNSC